MRRPAVGSHGDELYCCEDLTEIRTSGIGYHHFDAVT